MQTKFVAVCASLVVALASAPAAPAAVHIKTLSNRADLVSGGDVLVRVTAPARKLAHGLLAATGSVEWVDDEALMDAVTAVSGSGPAYVFLLVESLARAGAAAGLPADLSARLARATVSGAGELLHRSPLDAATLRQNVSSPGGTTLAALAVLMAEDGLGPLMENAVAAATKRSRELAG